MWISVSVPFEKYCKANIKTINMFCYSPQRPKFTSITSSSIVSVYLLMTDLHIIQLYIIKISFCNEMIKCKSET
jgi:hypothetical protein